MKPKWLITSLALSALVGLAPQAQAMIPVLGWGYTIGYGVDRLIGALPDDDLWSFWFDPPGETLLSGRMSLSYDPSVFTIVSSGWGGAFGADPSLPAPPVNPITETFPTLAPNGQPWALQSANAGLASNSVSIDPVLGRLTVQFDWGSKGYTPPTPDPFYFFGITVRAPRGTTGFQFVGPGTGSLGLLGSAADQAANGTRATTYLTCASGYCGETPLGDLRPVPEPTALLALGVGAAGLLRRRRKMP